MGCCYEFSGSYGIEFEQSAGIYDVEEAGNSAAEGCRSY